jgi:PAS domain S-box-containing protein
MGQIHALLNRQIKKHFGNTENISKELSDFIAAVDDAYISFDSDRELLERSIDISSRELMQNVSLLTATLEATDDGILVVDLNGKVVSYNHEFLKTWNIPENIAMTRDDNKLLDCVMSNLIDAESFLAKVRHLYSHPEEQSLDTIRFKDGRIIERFSTPQKIGGNIVGRVWSFRDITVKKQTELALKQSEQMLQHVMDNVPQSIFWRDRNSTYLGCNKSFAKDAGLAAPEDIIGKNDYDMPWKKEEADFYRQCDAKVMQSDTPRYHIIETQHQADGKESWIDTNKVPLHDADNNVIGIIGTYEDITERKHAEEEMKNLNEKLENANREMKNFLYAASHDLREPLRKISAFAFLLEKSLSGKISHDDSENLQFMMDGSNKMTKMIESLLAYSTIITKNLYLKTVKLDDLIDILKHTELAAIIAGSGATIDIPKPLPQVEADSLFMRQLLHNLIVNGIKYQKNGSIPHITIISKPAANGMVKIEITDNGIGIAPEFHQAIFTMFKRLHLRSEYDGIGIGLTLCKKIVERHDGQIGVESEPGKGSTFWFTVPAVKEPATIGKESTYSSKCLVP